VFLGVEQPFEYLKPVGCKPLINEATS